MRCSNQRRKKREIAGIQNCRDRLVIGQLALPIRQNGADRLKYDTLGHSYAFRISGEVFTQNGIGARDGVAMTTFDGNGGLTHVDWVMANGAIVPGPTNSYGFYDETGSYTVNPDCTGTAQINFPIPPHGTSGAVIQLMFVIVDGGRTIHTIVNSLTPPNTTTPVPANIHSDAVKVSPF